MRTLATLTLALAAVLAVAAGPAPVSGSAAASTNAVDAGTPEPVSLVPQVKIDRDLIRLGDIFRGTGHHAERTIGRAPEPGQSVTLDARWLARAARAFDLDWRPRSRFDIVQITRASRVVDSHAIRASLRAAVVERIGAGHEFEIELDNRLMALHVPTSAPPSIAVQRFQIDPNTHRFSALLVSPDTAPYTVQASVTGRLYELLDVPVPSRRIMRGEVVADRDIEMRQIRTAGLSPNAILDPGLLIGQSARRTLLTGAPVQENAIEPPVLVQRGGLVTVTLRAQRMVLTARAKALQAGSLNDVVRVMNMQSKQVIEGVVTGHGEVAVEVASPLAMN